jgi:hypothetical protein
MHANIRVVRGLFLEGAQLEQQMIGFLYRTPICIAIVSKKIGRLLTTLIGNIIQWHSVLL